MTAFVNPGGSDDGVVGSTVSHDKNGVVGRNDDVTARNAATPEGNGVFGSTQVPDGAGVFGLHNSGGVGVTGFGHPAGIGVVGVSAPAGAKGGDGVLGVSNSEHRNGIVGRNDSTTARGSADAGGNGVFGFTQVPDGAGVFGAHASTGVGVAGLGLIGVSGGSVNGVGVMGVSAPSGAKGGDGVQGITNSEFRNGVFGRNDSTTARGNHDPAGNGVFGFSQVPDGAGMLGAHGAGGHGVIGTGGFGVTGIGSTIGVWGQAQGDGWAGFFSGPVRVAGDLSVTGASRVAGDLSVTGGSRVDGDMEVIGKHTIGGNLSVTGNVEGSMKVNGNVTVTSFGTALAGNFIGDVVVTGRLTAGDQFINGDLTVKGDILLMGADCAEEFDIATPNGVEPGSVMVIESAGSLTLSEHAYDRRVAGVISGAGTCKTGITLDKQQAQSGRMPIALVGKVYCKVDASYAPIDLGDLLVTSPTPGHAMKATDPARAFGAVIGKALSALERGTSLLPILVSLQ